jgi:hypothetical protein
MKKTSLVKLQVISNDPNDICNNKNLKKKIERKNVLKQSNYEKV